jgi:hypothetical protein
VACCISVSRFQELQGKGASLAVLVLESSDGAGGVRHALRLKCWEEQAFLFCLLTLAGKNTQKKDHLREKRGVDSPPLFEAIRDCRHSDNDRLDATMIVFQNGGSSHV